MTTAVPDPSPAASATYADVDRSSDPDEAKAWMDRVATIPAIAASKRRSLALVSADRGPVLDLGCGLGEEVRALGPLAVGTDPSQVMLAEARRRGGRYVRAEGHHLPFRDAAFAAARADRVLQHVEIPEAVTAELVRVTRPGGTVAVTDPDQGTLQILGPDRELTATVVRFRAEDGIRHGYLAGRMHEVLAAAGCVDIGVERFGMELRDPSETFGLPTWSRFLIQRGLFDEAQADAFDASVVAADAAGTFRYRIDIVLTWGTVAATRP